MDQRQYESLYKRWLERDPSSRFWTNEIAVEYNMPSSEATRSALRRYRKLIESEENINKTLINSKTSVGNARILVFDLELAPLVCYSFGLWEENIGVDQVISDNFIISWSAKLLNNSEIISDVLTSKEALSKNDYRITKSLMDLLNSCHILIGHNIQNYDIKKLNVRLLKNNLPPLTKPQIIDTLLVARQNFSFPSNSLKYLSKTLGIRTKIETGGFDLWRRCMEGEEESLKLMDEYCQGDILANEDLYYRIRPFVKGHPNLSLYFDTNEERCPNCGSEELKHEGFYYTPAGKWASLRCECGAVSRSKVNELNKDKKKSLKVN